MVNESNRKPNSFYNKLMQEWLNNNDILLYSSLDKGKI